ncbi:MAG TPA: tripartite tricarboxylate transporter substrate binding protein [Peptococcaceae bacterium]|nr:tripartite tricarboxylate transporter substrate binding protein [Peptococcaceae bacterium]
MDDFKWAGKLVEDPIAVIVKADAPWNSLEEFAEWAKANPEKVTYGTTGPTGRPTFSIAELFDKLGIDFSKTNMIVTSGASEIISQIAGGHVHIGMNSVSEVSNMVKAGKIKMLAVTTKSSYFPDVPTMEELGYNDFKVNWWLGVAFPKDTPDYIVEKWEKAMEKASTDTEFLKKLESFNSEVSYLSAAEVKKLADEQYRELTDLAIKFGLRK